MAKPLPSTTEDAQRSERAQLVDLLGRIHTDHPVPQDLRALKGLLARNPRLWLDLGTEADLAVTGVLDAAATSPGTRLVLEAMHRQYKRELGWEEATPLERALMEVVAIAWLRLCLLIHRHAEATKNATPAGELLLWEKVISGAQRRFLQACESLARVRRMGLPSVSVSYSETRVEVSTDGGPTIDARPSEWSS